VAIWVMSRLGGSDHRRVDRAELQLVVARDELGDSHWIRGVDGLERQHSGGEIAEEPDLRLPAEMRRDQIGDLGDHERRDDQRPGMSFEQLEAGAVVGVVRVDVRVQGTGVDD
jgi:hypothetical protein